MALSGHLEQWRQEEEERDRELQFVTLRKAYRKVLHRERNSLTLGRRLDKALIEASMLSSAPASGKGDRRQGKPTSRKPPSAASAALIHGEFDLATEYGHRLELMVCRLEDEIYNYKIRQVGGGNESYEDRVARLLTYENLSDAEVAFIDPSQGSTRAIRSERRRHGYDASGRKVKE